MFCILNLVAPWVRFSLLANNAFPFSEKVGSDSHCPIGLQKRNLPIDQKFLLIVGFYWSFHRRCLIGLSHPLGEFSIATSCDIGNLVGSLGGSQAPLIESFF
jgi:hypothetical protein